jgi:hypothetical protein
MDVKPTHTSLTDPASVETESQPTIFEISRNVAEVGIC